MHVFEVYEVDAESVVEDEPMGTKNKFWVDLHDQTRWLFKYSREIRNSERDIAGEHWSEKVASEIAGIIGVPCAKVELAKYETGWGAISRKFPVLESDSSECGHTELVHGNELLAGAISDYDQNKKYGHSWHTFGNILTAISRATENQSSAIRDEAYRIVGGFVVLDALIMNVDRHHENWAMFRTSHEGVSKYSMAPSFDHASSLGRELTPCKINSWAIQGDKAFSELTAKYVRKGRGGVFDKDDDSRGLNPIDLVRIAYARWPYVIKPWLQRLSKVSVEDLCYCLDRLPDECIHELSKKFASELIGYTYSELVEIIK